MFPKLERVRDKTSPTTLGQVPGEVCLTQQIVTPLPADFMAVKLSTASGTLAKGENTVFCTFWFKKKKRACYSSTPTVFNPSLLDSFNQGAVAISTSHPRH